LSETVKSVAGAPSLLLWLILLTLVIALIWWIAIRFFSLKRWPVLTVTLAGLVTLPFLLLIVQLAFELCMMLRGERIVNELEKYRSAKGEYPLALSQIGIDEAKQKILYQRDFSSPEVFYLWFNTGFGTSSQYDSVSRTWHSPR
jgi:hypothetical protein